MGVCQSKDQLKKFRESSVNLQDKIMSSPEGGHKVVSVAFKVEEEHATFILKWNYDTHEPNWDYSVCGRFLSFRVPLLRWVRL